MINYCFMTRWSNCTKEEATRLLKTSDKPILYTFGLRYRHPSTLDEPITKERALEIFNETSYPCDVEESEDCIRLTAYSANDLY